jgi:tRNA(fMet)-specific endonuclease VapC
MARVILDTAVVIGLSRARLDLSSVIANDDVAVPAIAIAEFLAGIEFDPNAERRSRSQQTFDQVLTFATIEDYTSGIARLHAKLLVHTRRTGRPRGQHDLIIAATARATDRTLLTTDAKADFDELPGVRCRLLAV